MYFIRQVSKCT